jgi:ZIP family zinc transporter
MPAVSLLEAFWWGTVAASGVFAGALMGVYTRLTHTAIATTMALGAGMLLAAASVELASESVVEEPVGGIIALLAGAVSFSLANAYLATRGAKHRKRCGECVSQPREGEHPGSGTAIALGTAMDAVPESLVLGLSLNLHGPETALIAAIAIGNLPEAMSGAAGMHRAERSSRWILGIWCGVAIGTAVLTGTGFILTGVLSKWWALLLQAFGAGALLAMVTETLIPEAVQNSPRFSGIAAAAGFAALLLLTTLTH